MTGAVVYLLDADVFIQAKRNHYRFEVCPGFWAALIAQNRGGRLLSIDKVQAELMRGKDELSEWVEETAPSTMFAHSGTPEVTAAFRQVMTWVDSRDQYKPAAKSKFAGDADPWLIAFAKARGLVVVTHEESAELSKKKVKIPDVCAAMGVQVVNTFDMLADLGVSFSWQP